MLAFKVSLNGEEVCLAGCDDWMDLGALVLANRIPFPSKMFAEDQIELVVSGKTKPDAAGFSEEVRWKGRSLAVGAVVTVEVVETDAPGEPVQRQRSDLQDFPFTAEEWEEAERLEWLRLKAKYGPDESN